jgi:hypothetical protein
MEAHMPFCTIVEFEWDENLDRERFESLTRGSDDSAPDGRLARITGIDDTGARVVEVWQSGDDARAFAEQTVAVTGQMPAPARVVGFEVTSYTLD